MDTTSSIILVIVCLVSGFLHTWLLMFARRGCKTIKGKLMGWGSRQSTSNDPSTSLKGEKLCRLEEECFRGEACPDCTTPLLEGPRGGMSVNYACSACGSKFNDMGPFGIERLSDSSPNFMLDEALQRTVN
jgi:hypothetical protein